MNRSAELLAALNRALGVEAAWMISFQHDGQPKPKGRPRLGRGKTFTPQDTKAAETALAWQWKIALRGKTFDECLALSCVFYRSTHQRIDVDNMVKLVMDAGTKARAWADDCQVVMLLSRVEYDHERPRTEITLAPTQSSLDRTKILRRNCDGCGQEFELQARGRYLIDPKRGRFCSLKCAAAKIPPPIRMPQTHCQQGHPMTPENIVVKKGGGRYCRLCARARDREQYQNKKRV